ncbi:hypothetical protein [Thalassobacillus cyri]|nr:hypothetical protein [Thalassobacillus cyri]
MANDAEGTFNKTLTIMSEWTRRNPYTITIWNKNMLCGLAQPAV